jgi:uncharacterized protein YndB with AHSA1/START domain
MTEIRQEAEINAPAERIFAAIVDFHGYRSWLATSNVFEGISDISSDPIALGTTWSEHGPNGVRNGTVTLFEPATRVTFRQPMTMSPRFLGVIDITVSLTLTPKPASVHLRRVVTIGIPWQLKLVQPLVVRQFRTESRRTLVALKGFAEGQVKYGAIDS